MIASVPSSVSSAAVPHRSTLLSLIQLLQRYFELGEDEVVALAVSLINSGRVELTGNFAGERLSVH